MGPCCLDVWCSNGFHLLWGFDWRREEVFKEQKSFGVVKSLDYDTETTIDWWKNTPKTRKRGRKTRKTSRIGRFSCRCCSVLLFQSYSSGSHPDGLKNHTRFFHMRCGSFIHFLKKQTFVLHALLDGSCQLHWFHHDFTVAQWQIGCTWGWYITRWCQCIRFKYMS